MSRCRGYGVILSINITIISINALIPNDFFFAFQKNNPYENRIFILSHPTEKGTC